MSKLLQRGTAMLALIASLVFCSAALAQMPINPWKKAAPFPRPDEELYGAAVNGKMYVNGGFRDEGKAAGRCKLGVFRPGYRQMDSEERGMPRSAHHAAIATANGKLYVIGGFVPPKGHSDPDRRRVGTHRQSMREYDPAADSWKSLAPVTDETRRCRSG